MHQSDNQSRAGTVGDSLEGGVGGLRIMVEQHTRLFGHHDDARALAGESLGLLGVTAEKVLCAGPWVRYLYRIRCQQSDLHLLTRFRSCQAGNPKHQDCNEESKYGSHDASCLRGLRTPDMESRGNG